jgi:hypothetical protein
MNPGSLQGGTIGSRRKPSEAHPLRSADTGAFAVESIRRWWYKLSKHAIRMQRGWRSQQWAAGEAMEARPARIMSRGGCTSPAGQTSNASDQLARYASAGRRCQREVAMDERVSGAEVLGLLG